MHYSLPHIRGRLNPIKKAFPSISAKGCVKTAEVCGRCGQAHLPKSSTGVYHRKHFGVTEAGRHLVNSRGRAVLSQDGLVEGLRVKTDEYPRMACLQQLHLFPANLGDSACISEIVQAISAVWQFGGRLGMIRRPQCRNWLHFYRITCRSSKIGLQVDPLDYLPRMADDDRASKIGHPGSWTRHRGYEPMLREIIKFCLQFVTNMHAHTTRRISHWAHVRVSHNDIVTQHISMTMTAAASQSHPMVCPRAQKSTSQGLRTGLSQSHHAAFLSAQK